MEEQIKCIKSNRMPDENQDSFVEGKIYVPFAYNKVAGYGVFNEINQSHWIYEPGHTFFDQHFEILDEE